MPVAEVAVSAAVVDPEVLVVKVAVEQVVGQVLQVVQGLLIPVAEVAHPVMVSQAPQAARA